MKLQEVYQKKKGEIEKHLNKFRKNYKQSDKEIFAELCFCLLTPQSKAKICWEAIEKLVKNKLLYVGDENDIARYLVGVRFHNNKAKYIISARNFFSKNGKIKIKEKLERFNDINSMREYLAKNIKGFGMKEASHFLRNIGFYNDITILDRHILRNLKKHNVIDEIPKTLTKKKYLEIEKKMIEFSKKINIPLSHLDLLFWSMETGEIFK
ncbi:MAG: N-glycosylase/DNA lyase [Candidatus Aenigmatarchaeota archaeon]